MSKPVFTIDQAHELDITQLRRAGLFSEGETKGITLQSAEPGKPFPPTILLGCGEGEYTLRLIHFHQQGEERVKMDYRIYIDEVPANIGKGTLLFFICPDLGIRCRKLYLTASSPIWKSRKAYQGRLYYPIQVESKRWRANRRYWQLSNLLSRSIKRRAFLYNGRETKRSIRTRELTGQMRDLDSQRLLSLASSLTSFTNSK